MDRSALVFVDARKGLNPTLKSSALAFLSSLTTPPFGKPALNRIISGAVLIGSLQENIVAMSSAEKVFVKQLDCHLYRYNHFLSADAYPQKLYPLLLERTIELLNTGFRPGDPVGVMIVVKSSWLRQNLRKAVWDGSCMTYIGDTQEGDPIRITYFDNAKIG